MVGDTKSTSSSRRGTVLEQHETSFRVGHNEEGRKSAGDTWDDSSFDDEICKSISAEHEHRIFTIFEHELRTSSPPFGGPGCDSEASIFPEMSIDSNFGQLQLLTSQTRSKLPRTGSVLIVPPAVYWFGDLLDSFLHYIQFLACDRH
jgi:hypothetical protein